MTDDKSTLERVTANLRKARQEKGLTQAEVAKKAGVNENHYAQIERAEKNPTITTFISIIDAIGISPSEILDI